MRMRPPESEQPDITVDKLRALFGGKRQRSQTAGSAGPSTAASS